MIHLLLTALFLYQGLIWTGFIYNKDVFFDKGDFISITENEEAQGLFVYILMTALYLTTGLMFLINP